MQKAKNAEIENSKVEIEKWKKFSVWNAAFKKIINIKTFAYYTFYSYWIQYAL